jgi:hypothetical protein
MKLKLLDDDRLRIYVWVREDDHTQKISPHFDYREDAMQWYQQHSEQWDHYSGLSSTDFYQ